METPGRVDDHLGAKEGASEGADLADCGTWLRQPLGANTAPILSPSSWATLLQQHCQVNLITQAEEKANKHVVKAHCVPGTRL